MKPTEEQIEFLERLADRVGGQLDRSYSGRGMYGKRCYGIVLPEAGELVYRVMESAAREGFSAARTDSLGLGTIVYWPNMEAAPADDEPADPEAFWSPNCAVCGRRLASLRSGQHQDAVLLLGRSMGKSTGPQAIQKFLCYQGAETGSCAIETPPDQKVLSTPGRYPRFEWVMEVLETFREPGDPTPKRRWRFCMAAQHRLHAVQTGWSWGWRNVRVYHSPSGEVLEGRAS